MFGSRIVTIATCLLACSGSVFGLIACESSPSSGASSTGGPAASSGGSPSGSSGSPGTNPDGGTCVPSCNGKTCGADGCGGTCGTCKDAEFCDVTGACKTCNGGVAKTPVTVTTNELPLDPDFRGPGRGGESWHGTDPVNLPTEASPKPALDVYHRSWFTWARFETARGVYDFSRLEQEIKLAIDRGQKFSFGVMTVYPGDEANPSPNAGGSGMSYPMYLHMLMQDKNDAKNHGASDWNAPSAGWWLPNYNSDYYTERLDALYAALAAFLDTQTYKGVSYKNVIGYIDVRAFGSWGEWHHYPFITNASGAEGTAGSWPVNMRPTVASLKKIVDAHTKNFANYQLSAMLAAFDAQWLNNTWNPPEIAQYILDAKTNVGKLGWRRDQWGSTDNYISDYLENNNRSFNGGPAFKTAIVDRWKFAPVLGEPECSGADMAQLPMQVTFYHAAMIGNGNYCTAGTGALATNVREAAKRAGYRIVLKGGSTLRGTNAGQNLTVSLDWLNSGVAPTYENWKTTFELQNTATGAVIWSGTSAQAMRLFLPQAAPTAVADTLLLPATVPAGTYRLVLKVTDPTGYRAPLPLAIANRRADGSYPLVESFEVGTCK